MSRNHQIAVFEIGEIVVMWLMSRNHQIAVFEIGEIVVCKHR
jgi:hypothetical protein